MAVAVVDPFEVVQVEEQHRHHALVACGLMHRLAEAVDEQIAVGQLGQWVALGDPGQLLYLGLERGGVADDQHTAGVRVVIHWHRRDAHRQAGRVVVEDQHQVVTIDSAVSIEAVLDGVPGLAGAVVDQQHDGVQGAADRIAAAAGQ